LGELCEQGRGPPNDRDEAPPALQALVTCITTMELLPHAESCRLNLTLIGARGGKKKSPGKGERYVSLAVAPTFEGNYIQNDGRGFQKSREKYSNKKKGEETRGLIKSLQSSKGNAGSSLKK